MNLTKKKKMGTEQEVGENRGEERERPMHWRRKKSRRSLNQGRERRENKVFGLRKRKERRKKWKKELKSKSKSPRSLSIKFTRDTKNRVWKPDST